MDSTMEHMSMRHTILLKAEKIEQIPLHYWIGLVLVVDATNENECINAKTLNMLPLNKYKRILFKTKNSTVYYKYKDFYENFIYIHKSA